MCFVSFRVNGRFLTIGVVVSQTALRMSIQTLQAVGSNIASTHYMGHGDSRACAWWSGSRSRLLPRSTIESSDPLGSSMTIWRLELCCFTTAPSFGFALERGLRESLTGYRKTGTPSLRPLDASVEFIAISPTTQLKFCSSVPCAGVVGHPPGCVTFACIAKHGQLAWDHSLVLGETPKPKP